MKHVLFFLMVSVTVCGCLRSKPKAEDAASSTAADSQTDAGERTFGYTGAVIYVADAYECPPCVALKTDIAWFLKRKGWPDSDWQFEVDNTGNVPRIEYYRHGRVFLVHHGYSTADRVSRYERLNEIVEKHPFYTR